MELKELMSAFAETLGIEGIEVKDGICSMTIDDIPMEFTESPGGEAVVGVAVIGEPPPEKREAFYEMLLEANTQVYGTLGVALSKLPDTGEIALIGGLPFKDLEIKEFCPASSASRREFVCYYRWKDEIVDMKVDVSGGK